MKRISSLLAAIAILTVALAGCSRKAAKTEAEAVVATALPTATKATTPVAQQPMPADLLAEAIDQLEWSAVASTQQLMDNRSAYELAYPNRTQLYVGDIDKDSQSEMVFSASGFVLEKSEHTIYAPYYDVADSGVSFYKDSDGNVYSLNYTCGTYDYVYDAGDPNAAAPPNGLQAVEDRYLSSFSAWDGSDFSRVYSEWHITRSELSGDSYASAAEPYYSRYDVEFPSGQTLTGKEAEEYLEQVNTQYIKTTPRDYVTNSYDLCYAESLYNGLDAAFHASYPNYTDSLSGDFDGDGVDEQLFLIPDVFSAWQFSLPDWASPEHCYLASKPYTSVLIANPQDDRIVFHAASIADLGAIPAITDVRIEDSTLYVPNGASGQQATYYLEAYPYESAPSRSQLFQSLYNRLNQYGYSDIAFMDADLSDREESDLIALCKMNGRWNIFIFIILDGRPVPVAQYDGQSTACYLTQIDGKDHLLTYSQNIYSNGNGFTSYYNFSVQRFDEYGFTLSSDQQNLVVGSEQQDAAALSDFMALLQKYLVKIIIIRDPYALTGHSWPAEDALAFGTIPPDDMPPAETDATLGFVQIKDPSSWLNLREGPGTEYDRVLVDPSDPDSYVRQALGSPVTVLETIETGDPDNPVWVKIRIRYGDREFIGYSSKTFIRLQNEG